MKFTLQRVPNGRNLEVIGWREGYVLVRFAGRTDQWIYGPAIPEAEVAKVLRSPFPDRQFHLAIKKKYRCHKIGDEA